MTTEQKAKRYDEFKQSNRGMTREDILKIVDKCYGYAWLEFKMAESNAPDEHVYKTLMN